MNLNWNKCVGDKWCPFQTVDLDHSHFRSLGGVYVIWHGSQNASTVYVGQGAIADRLRAHRQDQGILQYSPQGLFVTWVRVEPASRGGVERFLSERLRPKAGARSPDAQPIQVNLPW